ncbi:lecithin retinol acyltransferase family protein [Burkholderia metallica]|uniref:lecithin retinol acyltransferase family protein n=1 Tax=Burkholderia metallica TaxID=488729 RepID=UPI001CF5A681|nr:lecithin retinol acyltransferase family protein [Burkholderia metallica]MCA8003399.1 lecithin retinol acyltransferase family protein [Burkholderia metallica]
MTHPTAAQAVDASPDRDLPVGAHLVARRHGYVHHGIYIGDGNVIHYAGLARRLNGGPVEIVSVDDFCAGFELAIVRHAQPLYDGTEAARRAASRLGECRYRLLTNNCEHFCLWCLFGVGRSDQVVSCLRNPVHGIAVVVMLLACVLAARLQAASVERATDARTCPVRCGA